MQRITVTLDDELVAEIDRVSRIRGYQNRSEAIRDLVRAGLTQHPTHAEAPRECLATLTYVYDHGERELPKRLTHAYHDHHDLSVASLHVHLDHESCLEVSVLKGSAADVQHFANHMIAERGVRHGRLVMLPVDIDTQKHNHGSGAGRHTHIRVRDAG